MKLLCPKCQRPFPAEQVNVASDVAFCPPCNEGFALSRLVDGETAGAEPDIDFTQPPTGITYEPQPDGVILTASTRSWQALILILFACVCSGFSLVGLYGSQSKSGTFSWFPRLFSVVSLLGTVWLLHDTVLRIFGMVRLTIRGDEGEIFTGYFDLGRRRSFRIPDVRRVREETSSDGESSSTALVIEGKQELRFGSDLNAERRRFVLGALRKWTRKR